MDWPFATMPAFVGLLAFFAGLLVAGLGLALRSTRRTAQARAEGAAARDAEVNQLHAQMSALREALTRLQNERDALLRNAEIAQAQLIKLTTDHATQIGRLERLTEVDLLVQRQREEIAQLRSAREQAEQRAVRLGTQNEEQATAARDKLALLESAREQLTASFKTLATDILEDKSKRFSDLNKDTLGQLLSPLREQLKDFHKNVSEERSQLMHELGTLKSLNVRIGEDALNLTRALKGEARTQGAWGELILERILEASGLEKGREYETQTVLTDDMGGRPRPDVIVRLPEGRDLIVDAKVSLTAYERYCSAADDQERELHLGLHVASVRSHVKQLSARGYGQLPGINSLDFVLMFVPIEAAFMEAVRRDDRLHADALEQQVVIVTTSTLLATLRTVASLWRIAAGNQNARRIVEDAGKLYDKFVAFVEDLEKVRNAQSNAEKALDGAFKKLVGGRGSLVKRTEDLKKLGAKAAKSQDPKLLERAQTEELLRLDAPEPQVDFPGAASVDTDYQAVPDTRGKG